MKIEQKKKKLVGVDLQKLLKSLPACKEAVVWSKGKSLAKAWETCEKPEWMLWLLGKLSLDGRISARIAIRCARYSLQYASPGDDRPRLAIEASEKYLDGKIGIDELRSAQSAAWSAAQSADAAGSAVQSADAAGSAVWSADAAGSAAWSAKSAQSAAWSARSAAWSAVQSADAAGSAAWSAAQSADAAGSAANKELAGYVRELVSVEMVEGLIKALDKPKTA